MQNYVWDSGNIYVGLVMFLQLFTPKISITIIMVGKFCITIHMHLCTEAY